MELINIGQTSTSLEDLFTILAILFLIVGVIVIIWTISEWVDAYDEKKRAFWKKATILPVAMLTVAIGLIIANCNIDPVTTYTYHVTDMQQLSDTLDNGWSVVNKDNPIYTLMKGE